MAMVVSTLTGNSTITPLTIRDFNEKNGLVVTTPGGGAVYDNSFKEVAKNYGLKHMEVKRPFISDVKSQLASGKTLVIARMKGPGTFTMGGHYVVLTGITSDISGEWFTVYDPNYPNRNLNGPESKGNIIRIKDEGKEIVKARTSIFWDEALCYHMISK